MAALVDALRDTEVFPWRRGRLRIALVRIRRLLISLWCLVTLAFAMIHLIPGDPVRAALGPTASPEVVAQRRAQLGLNHPIPIQYVHYLGDVLTGHLGTSAVSEEPVSAIIASRLPKTAILVGLSFLVIQALGFLVGIGLAIATARGKRRGLEVAYTASTGALISVPDFLVSFLLVILFAVTWPIFPVAGYTGPTSLVLPVAALSLPPAASLSRIVRVEALRVMGQNYMQLARSKRLPARLIYLRHMLPNILTASMTVGGVYLVYLIGGTVLVENVFNWPGLGSEVVSSIAGNDYSVVQAIVLVLGGAALVISALIDLTVGFVDPRSTLREGRR